MAQSIWEPPEQDSPPRGTRRDTEGDSSALDLTLAILIVSLIGLAVYYLGKLLWVVWPTIRWFPDVPS